MDCLFCKIAIGDIPSEKVYEDENVYAFKDINPCAPVHVLVIPKKHIDGIDKLSCEGAAITGAIFIAIKDIAEQLGIEKDGYRVISNVLDHGGQTVRHLHFHLIGGAKLSPGLATPAL
ncbi:histidine triad nucleotide-binding protein [Clostridia bacterium]|nr:histidine triad nucleotide-binding protein [Clostridia bacterium]